MLTPETRKTLLGLSTPMLVDARASLGLHASHLDPGIRPVVPYSRMVGTAVTVRLEQAADESSADLLPLVDAYESQQASSGWIMVIQVPTELHSYGIFGEGSATMGRRHGFVGALVEGAARDTLELKAMAFPVFSRTIAPGFMLGLASVADVGGPVQVAGRTIHAGDVICADNDGVVVVRPDELADVVAKALAIDAWEHAHNSLMAQGTGHEEAKGIVGSMP